MNILSFDVESNGLHGEAFAVAGVVLDEDSRVVSQIVLRTAIIGPVDPWVSENVLGPMKSIANSNPDARGMRDEFWAWYIKAKSGAGLIVAANPYPVEARFLISCQNDDRKAREFDHPFPFYDLSSMLYTLGFTTPTTRREFVAGAIKGITGESHNPLWDAKATAMAAQRAVVALSALPQSPPSQ